MCFIFSKQIDCVIGFPLLVNEYQLTHLLSPIRPSFNLSRVDCSACSVSTVTQLRNALVYSDSLPLASVLSRLTITRSKPSEVMYVYSWMVNIFKTLPVDFVILVIILRNH